MASTKLPRERHENASTLPPRNANFSKEQSREMMQVRQRQDDKKTDPSRVRTGLAGLSFKRTALIYWSFSWRSVIGGMFVALSVAVLAWFEVQNLVVLSIATCAMGFAVMTEVMYRVLDIRWNHFRLSWINETTDEEQNSKSIVSKEAKWRRTQAAMVLWSWLWRAAIGTVLFGIITWGRTDENVVEVVGAVVFLVKVLIQIAALTLIEMAALALALERTWNGHRFVVAELRNSRSNGRRLFTQLDTKRRMRH